MQLSLSGFLFEDDYATQSCSFQEFCGIAAEAGYEGVELRRTQVSLDTPALQRRAIRRTVQAHGLSVTCLTARGMPSSASDREAFFLRYLDVCNDLECPLMKIGGDSAWIAQAVEQADQADVVLAMNNHVGGPLMTVAGTREVLGRLDHRNFGLLYDCLHLYFGGEDYVGCIREFFPRVRNVLVHSVREARADEACSYEIHGRRWVNSLLDEPGGPDFAAVLGEFAAVGYDGWITVIENGWPADRRPEVAGRCAREIRRLWSEAKEQRCSRTRRGAPVSPEIEATGQ